MSEQDEFGRTPEPRHPLDFFGMRDRLRQQPAQSLQDFLRTSTDTLRNAINANEALPQRGREARDRLAAATGVDLTPEGLVRISLRRRPAEGADDAVETREDNKAQDYYDSLFDDLPELDEGTVFEYPVRIDQRIPGIGYLVSDRFSGRRSYWLTEAGLTDESRPPKATATVKSLDDTTLVVTVHSAVGSTPLERKFDRGLLLEGQRDGVISVLDSEASAPETISVVDDSEGLGSVSIPVTSSDDAPEPEQQEETPEPEIGMRVEFQVWLHRVIDGYAALVSDSPGSQQYSVRLDDVELPDDYDDGESGKLAKIRGTVTGVSDEKIYIELFSPSDQYDRHYPRSLAFKDVSVFDEPVPGNLYRSYGKFDTMVYDGEYFIPMATFPEGKKTRAELPKRLQDLGHIYDNM